MHNVKFTHIHKSWLTLTWQRTNTNWKKIGCHWFSKVSNGLRKSAHKLTGTRGVQFSSVLDNILMLSLLYLVSICQAAKAQVAQRIEQTENPDHRTTVKETKVRQTTTTKSELRVPSDLSLTLVKESKTKITISYPIRLQILTESLILKVSHPQRILSRKSHRCYNSFLNKEILVHREVLTWINRLRNL